MKHGGLREILRLHKAPGMAVDWPNEGRYVSGIARYQGDPEAWCATRQEARDKIRRQGKTIVRDD